MKEKRDRRIEIAERFFPPSNPVLGPIRDPDLFRYKINLSPKNIPPGETFLPHAKTPFPREIHSGFRFSDFCSCSTVRCGVRVPVLLCRGCSAHDDDSNDPPQWPDYTHLFLLPPPSFRPPRGRSALVSLRRSVPLSKARKEAGRNNRPSLTDGTKFFLFFFPCARATSSVPATIV